MNYLKHLPLLLVLAILCSCAKKDDNNSNSGDPQAILGDVGNEWTAKFNNEQTMSGKILANEDGYLTIEINLDDQIDTIYLHYDGNKVSEFIHSDGDLTKPFTMVEFDCKIGDSYSFQMGELNFYREVTEMESYYNEALGKEIPTIGVYEEIPYGINFQLFGYYIQSIIWYWHPTYGLVCVDVYTSDGQFIEIIFFQIDL